jgi:ABC-2 type transport system permease protein
MQESGRQEIYAKVQLGHRAIKRMKRHEIILAGGSGTRILGPVLEYDSAIHRPTVWGELRELVRYRDLLRVLISKTIKTRYKRSAIGILWTLLNPLLTMLVLTVAFSAMMRSAVPSYPVFLLIGLVVWNLFSGSTAWSMGTYIGAGGLLKKAHMPPTIFAVACVGNCLINFFFSLVPLCIMMLFQGHPFYATWWFVPIAVLLVSAFSLGVALFISTLGIFFSDVVEMYQIALQAWFYLTPIIYPAEFLSSRYEWLLWVNPMYHMIELVRAPIFGGHLPHASTLIICTLWAFGSLVGGAWYFVRKSDEFAYSL